MQPNVVQRPCENPKGCKGMAKIRFQTGAPADRPVPQRDASYWECPECGFKWSEPSD